MSVLLTEDFSNGTVTSQEAAVPFLMGEEDLILYQIICTFSENNGIMIQK